jgi:acyl dehydratase
MRHAGNKLVMQRISLGDLAAWVGREIAVSDWLLVDQHRIDRFAEVTQDRQWIHVDVERARREIGGPIAHGLLTLSLLPALTASVVEFEGVTRGLNYGFDRVRFLSPVAAGARIRSRHVLKAVEPKAGGVAVTQTCTVEIEGAEKPALVCDWIGVFYA